MDSPLDDLYLMWLCTLVRSEKVKRPAKTHILLLRQLYKREFVWMVPNDNNRAEDGKELRRVFRDKYDIPDIDSEWMGLGCSVLELLISLSNILSFEAEEEPNVWFWRLLENLGLHNQLKPEDVDEILTTFIWRTYDRLGHGGLFPLQESMHDQRTVELWYQLCEYVIERM